MGAALLFATIGVIQVKKSCSYCSRIHPVGYECPRKPKRKKRDTKTSRFRSTYAWQKKREEIGERDHRLCRVCLDKGIINHRGIGVHHIIPLEEREDLGLVDANLISLCERHHEEAESGVISRSRLHELAKAPPYPMEG